jgi:hypothetical protein
VPQVFDQAHYKTKDAGTVIVATAAAHVSTDHAIVVLVVVEMVIQDAIITHRSIRGVCEIAATIHHRVDVVAIAAVNEVGDSTPPDNTVRKASEFLSLCPSGRFRVLVDCLGLLLKSVAKLRMLLLLLLLIIIIMLLLLVVWNQRQILFSRQSVAAAAAAAASASDVNDGESL